MAGGDDPAVVIVLVDVVHPFASESLAAGQQLGAPVFQFDEPDLAFPEHYPSVDGKCRMESRIGFHAPGCYAVILKRAKGRLKNHPPLYHQSGPHVFEVGAFTRAGGRQRLELSRGVEESEVAHAAHVHHAVRRNRDRSRRLLPRQHGGAPLDPIEAEDAIVVCDYKDPAW